MSATDDRTKEKFEQYCRRTRRWAIRIEFELLHSLAYTSVTYGPAVKVLNWFFEKRSISINKRKRGDKRYVVRDEEILFTYEEAAARGLDHKKFARAIRELHARGFIDVVHLGSGLRGNPNKYRLSERWRAFRTDAFENVAFPENRDWKHRFSVELANGELRRHIPRDAESGKWTRRSGEISQRQISAVVRRPKNAVVNSDRRQISAVQQANFDQNTTAVSPSTLSTTKGYTTSEEEKKKVSDSEVENSTRAHAVAETSIPSNGQPKVLNRGELLKGTAKVLEQLPDHPRVRDRRFAEFIAGQLGEIQRARLDSDKVRRAFEDREFLPDFVINDLFSLIGIAGSGNGDFSCGPWAECEALTADYDWCEEATP